MASSNLFFDLIQEHLEGPKKKPTNHVAAMEAAVAAATTPKRKSPALPYAGYEELMRLALDLMGDPRSVPLSGKNKLPSVGWKPLNTTPAAPEPSVYHARLYLRGRNRFALDMRLDPGDVIPEQIRLPQDAGDFAGCIGTFLTTEIFKAWHPDAYPSKISDTPRVFQISKQSGEGTPHHEIYYSEVT